MPMAPFLYKITFTFTFAFTFTFTFTCSCISSLKCAIKTFMLPSKLKDAKFTPITFHKNHHEISPWAENRQKLVQSLKISENI